MKAVDLTAADLLEIPSDGGVITFGGSRTVLYDVVALGHLRKQLVEAFGTEVARGLLTRLGYFHGWRTAELMREQLPWDDEDEWRRAGGFLHRLQGLVRFEPVEDRRMDAVAEAIWLDSYEAEQHVLHLGRSDDVACWTLTGFASGYLSHVFDESIYAIEETCCAHGDAVCHMVARTTESWGEAIEPHLHYYEKDCIDETLRELQRSVKALEREVRSRRRALGPEAEVLDTAGIVARSRHMRRVLEVCRRVASVDTTVVIHGESGSGKERIARFIHDQSRRTAGPLISINCGALPPALLESELFGHVKGAFTGATEDRIGLFEAANGGTLMLDEIGDVPAPLQVRLLRVLQERQVRRVGENVDRPVDVRVIAATHRDLDEEVAAGRFREDLLYRLRVVSIEIPPLRDRPDDILPLARAKLIQTAQNFKRDVQGFSKDATKALLAHSWPGNVRELQNVVERAVVFADHDVIDADDLQILVPRTEATTPVAPIEAGTLADVERAHILATLEAANGNRTEAARRLGIGVATIHRKLKRYGAS